MEDYFRKLTGESIALLSFLQTGNICVNTASIGNAGWIYSND